MTFPLWVIPNSWSRDQLTCQLAQIEKMAFFCRIEVTPQTTYRLRWKWLKAVFFSKGDQCSIGRRTLVAGQHTDVGERSVGCPPHIPRRNAHFFIHSNNSPITDPTSLLILMNWYEQFQAWTSTKNFWSSKLCWPIVRSMYQKIHSWLPWITDVKCSFSTDKTRCQHQVSFLLRC